MHGMCGKFSQLASWRDVHAFSKPLTVSGQEEIVVSTPMRQANVMRLNGDGERELVSMRWGFAGRDDAATVRPKHMHVRAETIDARPTFAWAFAGARGILMVSTFNEGEELPNGKTKQWVIAPQDKQPIAIAVICEEWLHDREPLQTFVMVTTPANALISRITDRMPAILPREGWNVWLGEAPAPLDEVTAVLRTFEDDGNWMMKEQVGGKLSRPPKPPSGQLDLF